eukprot:g55098.t1
MNENGHVTSTSSGQAPTSLNDEHQNQETSHEVKKPHTVIDTDCPQERSSAEGASLKTESAPGTTNDVTKRNVGPTPNSTWAIPRLEWWIVGQGYKLPCKIPDEQWKHTLLMTIEDVKSQRAHIEECFPYHVAKSISNNSNSLSPAPVKAPLVMPHIHKALLHTPDRKKRRHKPESKQLLFEIAEVRGQRWILDDLGKMHMEYLVKWKESGAAKESWESSTHVQKQSPSHVLEFHQRATRNPNKYLSRPRSKRKRKTCS